jgi:hypothetical protein
MTTPRFDTLLWLAATAFCTAPAIAQCTTQWRTDGPFATTGQQVWSVASWDADGAGPLAAAPVVGRGSGGSGSIQRWDVGTNSWVTLGSTNGRPLCLLAAQNGDLLVGGDFTTVNGVAVARLARWSGGSWSSVGGGVTFSTLQASVQALAELPGGAIAVAGFFNQAGGVPAASLARWDGGSWSTFGSGANGDVRSLVLAADGSLVAGGSFSQMGGVPASRVARWNGSTWSALGSGLSSTVRDLCVRADGALVAASIDTFVWNGTTWTLLAGNPDYQIAVVPLPNGDLISGGLVTTLRRWNGTSWSAIGPGTSGFCNDLMVLPGGDVLVGGQFQDGASALSPLQALTTTCPASAAPLGDGCLGQIEARSLPWAGSVLTTRGTGLPEGSLVAAVFGLSTMAETLDQLFPFGVSGCSALVTPDVYGLLSPVDGIAVATVSLPNDPAVAGVLLFEQWVALAQSEPGVFTAATSTNALQFTLGAF